MITLFWFRRDLRLNDNHGLHLALQQDAPVLPLFIFDTEILDRLEQQDTRLDFIHQQVHALKKELEQLGSTLIIRHGKPEKVFREILKEYPISGVFANEDHEPYGRNRDREVETLLSQTGIPFSRHLDHLIFHPDQVVKSDGNPYTVYTPYMKRWRSVLDDRHLKPWPSEASLKNLHRHPAQDGISLAQLGFRKSGRTWPAAVIPVEIIRSYDKTRDFPAIQGTSRLGIHLRFGTISIRQLMKVALRENPTYMNELIWREFFMMILWHYPHVVNNSFRPAYDRIQWINSEDDFRRWREGTTGYPLVDAGMRELYTTGYMHNRVRMVTASFLTKHLMVDWRWGESWFAKHLLDYELSSNNGGWQWAAGSGCDAAPYFRIFNPTTQQKRFDPNMTYIKRWVPEFGNEHYPKPIVEHTLARKRALEIYQKALK